MVFKEGLRFFNETVWTVEIKTLPLHKRLLYRAGRIIFIVIKGFKDELLNQQAAALTFVSFLSIIPFMAVLFSLAKEFGFEDKVVPWIRNALHLVDEEILNQIIEYVADTNVAALGALGSLFLLWTIMKTLLTMERSFNRIWHVDRCRPMYRALAYYLSVMLIVPLLVAASTTLMAAMHTEKGGWLEGIVVLPGAEATIGLIKDFLPFLIIWVAFSLVYAFMVNTHVSLFAAMSGGFVTSLLWNLLQWLYLETQIGLSRNAIYGTFAFLPVFLLYLYLSWLILLFGCRIAFALQNESAYRRYRIASAAGTRYRIASGLRVLHEIARAFERGEKLEKPEKIADRLDLPTSLVLEMVARMTRADILRRVANEGNGPPETLGLAPARALELIAVKDVVSALEDHDGSLVPLATGPSDTIDLLLEKAERARDDALEGVMVSDLLE